MTGHVLHEVDETLETSFTCTCGAWSHVFAGRLREAQNEELLKAVHTAWLQHARGTER